MATWDGHSSYCNCAQCKDMESLFARWIKQKADNLVSFHTTFNAGHDTSLEPDLVRVLLNNVGLEAKQLIERHTRDVVQSLQFELAGLRLHLAQRDYTIERLNKEIDTRKAVYVPDTEGRLFRQD